MQTREDQWRETGKQRGGKKSNIPFVLEEIVEKAGRPEQGTLF